MLWCDVTWQSGGMTWAMFKWVVFRLYDIYIYMLSCFSLLVRNVAYLSLVLLILCNDVPWMTLDEFPSPFFYMLPLCLHFIAYLHCGQCALQVWGKGLEKKIYFLFSMFSICCFLFLYFVLVSMFVSIFLCLVVCRFCLFSISVCWFGFCAIFCFVVFVLFCRFTFLHAKIETNKIFQLLLSNVFCWI